MPPAPPLSSIYDLEAKQKAGSGSTAEEYAAAGVTMLVKVTSPMASNPGSCPVNLTDMYS